MTSWQGDTMTTWLNGNWLGEKLRSWQVDKLTSWQDDKLTNWQVDKYVEKATRTLTRLAHLKRLSMEKFHTLVTNSQWWDILGFEWQLCLAAFTVCHHDFTQSYPARPYLYFLIIVKVVTCTCPRCFYGFSWTAGNWGQVTPKWDGCRHYWEILGK